MAEETKGPQTHDAPRHQTTGTADANAIEHNAPLHYGNGDVSGTPCDTLVAKGSCRNDSDSSDGDFDPNDPDNDQSMIMGAQRKRCTSHHRVPAWGKFWQER